MRISGHITNVTPRAITLASDDADGPRVLVTIDARTDIRRFRRQGVPYLQTGDAISVAGRRCTIRPGPGLPGRNRSNRQAALTPLTLLELAAARTQATQHADDACTATQPALMLRSHHACLGRGSGVWLATRRLSHRLGVAGAPAGRATVAGRGR
jgi:hypothetical protein